MSEWTWMRARAREYWDWYSGHRLDEMPGSQIDPDTGQPSKRYPLGLNPIAKACRIHQAVMIGSLDEYDVPPIQVTYHPEQDDEKSHQEAHALQNIVRRTWGCSDGAALQLEAALLEQINGGHVFKVAFEPDNLMLPYRIRYVGLRAEWLYPIYDVTNPWVLKEAYLGYMIPAKIAEDYYGIDPHLQREVLYMEHWTPDLCIIRVDGIVPELEGKRLEFEHKWGVVPIVYIPHTREHGVGELAFETDREFWGRSLVPSLTGLTEEKNARATDWGDAVDAATHPELVGVNIRQQPQSIPLDIPHPQEY